MFITKFAMDDLDAKQKVTVQLLPQAHILNKLLALGPQLMDWWTHYISNAKKPMQAAAALESKFGYDPEIERLRLELERERFNQEMELKKQERALEEQKLAAGEVARAFEEQKRVEEKSLKERRRAEKRALEEKRITLEELKLIAAQAARLHEKELREQELAAGEGARALEERRLIAAQAARAWEGQKMAAEKALLEQKIAAKKEARADEWEKRTAHEHQMAKERREHEVKMIAEQIAIEEARRAEIAEIALERKLAEDRSRAEEAKVINLVTRFGKALRSVLGIMPNDPIEMIDYFRDAEVQMDRLEVPEDIRAIIMRPFLNRRGKTLVARLDPDVTANYQSMKHALLRELGLTPREYLNRFQTSTRQDDESHRLWISRLRAILRAYLESRRVETLEELKSLLVADRVKQVIEGTALGEQVHSIEAQKGEGAWLKDQELALVLDLFAAGQPPGRERNIQSQPARAAG
jgi:hypothetical protein